MPTPPSTSPNQHSPWAPLNNKLFRALWIASLISSLGTWIQQVASGWLMTSLAPQPIYVALVEVANALPMFFLSLPAGALADVADRRRYLLATQVWMMAAALTMGILTLTHHMTPPTLILCAFIMSVGVAMNSPGWHSVTPEIVPRETLPSAVALNGLSINGAKAIGPALGGLILLWMGAGAAFLLNALSFLGVVSVLFAWKRRIPHTTAPPENFSTALKVGLRHVRHSRPLRHALIRSSLFLIASSALWALLPLLCRQDYSMGPSGYGILVASFGLGAVLATIIILPRCKSRYSTDHIATSAWLTFTCALFGLAQLPGGWAAALCMVFGGAGWLCLMAQLHLVVQSSAPAWVQARAMSIYLLGFFGAAACGSMIWGVVAQYYGVRQAFEAAAFLLLITSFSAVAVPLETGDHLNLEPSHAWPTPEVATRPPDDHGPILVVVEYDIDPKDATEFTEAIEGLRTFRYQNGAQEWGIFVDIENPTLYREIYLEQDWGSHLRQHERVSSYETEVASRVYAFHRREDMPIVKHFAFCDERFPTGNERPVPKSYPVTGLGVPLWFIEELTPSYDTTPATEPTWPQSEGGASPIGSGDG